MATMVDVGDLRVGMFIHLDLGWWAHPFALSSFMITSPEQIEQIRALGKRQFRWSPEKSRPLDGPTTVPAEPLPPGPPMPVAQAAEAPAGIAGSAVPGAAPPSTTPVHAAPGGPATAQPSAPSGQAADNSVDKTASKAVDKAGEPVALDRVRQRSALAQQREAQALCQRQVAEARDAWADAARLVSSTPQQSREIAEGLTRALLDKMMVDQDMCVRVLSDEGCDPVAGHALNVAVVSLLMGRVFGFPAEDMLDMGVGALMHDIGKLELPERARYDDDRCGPSDQALYREHVAQGVAQGRRMGLSEGALQVIAQHHEMADASGFPQRLVLDRMGGPARIVALVNRYDKLCNPRHAAQALTPHEALSMIFAQCKTKFDASMLNAFVRMMGVYPPGSVVQLTDDRYATVVSVNSTRPLKPRVLVCDPAVPPDEALLLSLDREHNLGIRRSLKPLQLPAAVRDYLSPRQRMVYFFEPLVAAGGSAAEELAA